MPVSPSRNAVLTSLAVALAAVLLIAGAPRSADAAPLCLPHEALTTRLADRFGETLRARGAATPVLVEIFANTDTGTFSIVVIRPGRSEPMACIAAAGDGWQEFPAVNSPAGRDS